MDKWIVCAAAGVGALSLTASVCLAEPIKDRQELMKANNATVEKLVKMLEGESPFDAAVVKKEGEDTVVTFVALKDLFPPGTENGPPETWAKPEIWSDPAGFEAARQKAEDAARALSMVSEASELEDAVGALGEACKGCHEPYRRPKDD
jgi:cytochrome c556